MNKWVFSRDLNNATESEARIVRGRLFHSPGAARANAQSPQDTYPKEGVGGRSWLEGPVVAGWRCPDSSKDQPETNGRVEDLSVCLSYVISAQPLDGHTTKRIKKIQCQGP